MSLSLIVACATGRLRDQFYKINSYTKLANPGLLLASARRYTPSLAADYALQGLWCQSFWVRRRWRSRWGWRMRT